MTLGEFRNQLGFYNKTINNYNRVFQCYWNNGAFIEEPVRTGLKDYSTIKNAFELELKRHQSRIKEFQRDFYTARTIASTATFLGIQPEELVVFLNKSKSQFHDIVVFDEKSIERPLQSIPDLLVQESIIRKVSSYDISMSYARHKMKHLLSNRAEQAVTNRVV